VSALPLGTFVVYVSDLTPPISLQKPCSRWPSSFLAALEEAPVPIALHPATLDRYIETVNSLAETMAGHAGAADDRGL
jgi:hypothetical protein